MSSECSRPPSFLPRRMSSLRATFESGDQGARQRSQAWCSSVCQSLSLRLLQMLGELTLEELVQVQSEICTVIQRRPAHPIPPAPQIAWPQGEDVACARGVRAQQQGGGEARRGSQGSRVQWTSVLQVEVAADVRQEVIGIHRRRWQENEGRAPRRVLLGSSFDCVAAAFSASWGGVVGPFLWLRCAAGTSPCLLCWLPCASSFRCFCRCRDLILLALLASLRVFFQVPLQVAGTLLCLVCWLLCSSSFRLLCLLQVPAAGTSTLPRGW